MRASIPRLIIFVSLVLFAAPASAFDEPWQVVLDQQLRSQRACEVIDFQDTRKQQHDGELVIITRAVCADGRHFDAKREREHLKFVINICETRC